LNIFIQLKSMGRKNAIKKESFYIPSDLENVNDLVKFIVSANVREYNSKEVDKPIFKFLSNDEIKDGESFGKIAFKDRKNENQQDEQAAIDNALQSFEDGIFKIFINDNEIQHNEEINLNDGDVLTFIRLTMLAGRLW